MEEKKKQGIREKQMLTGIEVRKLRGRQFISKDRSALS